jgi:hypothetical protein
MNRTIVGRITALRGLRHQAETYIRQSLELRDWAPVAIVVLLYVFRKSYSAERRAMREERMSDLRTEKKILDRTSI